METLDEVIAALEKIRLSMRAVSPLPKIVWEDVVGPLVYVPAVPFLMGSTEDNQQVYDNERPQHEVNLDDFYIGRYPVTNAQYARFIEDRGYEDGFYWMKEGWDWRVEKGVTQPLYWENPKWNQPNHPVVGVSWYESQAYCRWLGCGGELEFRLPTEAEWEKAARGTGGREWPWGNDFDSQKANANGGRLGGTTPVGQYSPAGDSPYGAADMAGNVWEWCQDWFAEDDYQHSLLENPPGSAGGHCRAARGGSWGSGQGGARCACRGRDGPVGRGSDVGFRVAASPSSP